MSEAEEGTPGALMRPRPSLGPRNRDMGRATATQGVEGQNKCVDEERQELVTPSASMCERELCQQPRARAPSARAAHGQERRLCWGAAAHARLPPAIKTLLLLLPPLGRQPSQHLW